MCHTLLILRHDKNAIQHIQWFTLKVCFVFTLDKLHLETEYIGGEHLPITLVGLNHYKVGY